MYYTWTIIRIGNEHVFKFLEIYFYLFSIDIVPTPISQRCRKHDSASFELGIYSKERAYFRRRHHCHQLRSRFYGVHRWCSFLGHHCRWYYWCECNWCNRMVRSWAYEALVVPMYSWLLLTSMWWPSCVLHSILFLNNFVKLSQRQQKIYYWTTSMAGRFLCACVSVFQLRFCLFEGKKKLPRSNFERIEFRPPTKWLMCKWNRRSAVAR